MPTYDNGAVGAPYAKVEAVNTGHRAVTVKTISLELPKGGRLTPMSANTFPGMSDTPLPATLSDGQTAFMMMSYESIGKALLQKGIKRKIMLTPVCVDTADNVYRGQPWQVDPKEFTQMAF